MSHFYTTVENYTTKTKTQRGHANKGMRIRAQGKHFGVDVELVHGSDGKDRAIISFYEGQNGGEIIKKTVTADEAGNFLVRG